MISIEEINKSILDLEQHDTTFATCERLAWLYIVKDHINENKYKTVTVKGGSRFRDVASGCDMKKLFDVLDEHFNTLRAIYPKEYDAIINKLL